MNYQQSDRRTLAITVRAGPGPRHQGQRHSAGLRIRRLYAVPCFPCAPATVVPSSPASQSPSLRGRHGPPLRPASQSQPRACSVAVSPQLTSGPPNATGEEKGIKSTRWPLPSSSRLKSWRYEYYASHAQQFISNIIVGPRPARRKLKVALVTGLLLQSC
jgi:hypothetical protein